MFSVKSTRTHVYYCMKNSPLNEDDFREDLLNVVDHYQVQFHDKVSKSGFAFAKLSLFC